MKYKVTIVALLISACFLITKKCKAGDLVLLPVKEEMWTHTVTIYAGDNFCQTTNRDSGEYVLMAIPTVLININYTLPIIHGYPGDGFINENQLCPGTSYQIPQLQQFVIRDYCTGEIIRQTPKNYFALQDNYRPFYYNRNTGQVVRSLFGSVVDDLLSLYPYLDSNVLARAPSWSDTTQLDLQFTSPGHGDFYGCSELGNQVDVTGLEGRHLIIDVILHPTEFSNQQGMTYSFHVLLGLDNELYFGSALPAYDCPPLCDNIDPLQITVTGDSVFFPHTSCDISDLEILIWNQKKNSAEYRVSETISLTTETSYWHNNKLNYNDLQFYSRQVFPDINGEDWTIKGGKFNYGYKIGNTIYKP